MARLAPAARRGRAGCHGRSRRPFPPDPARAVPDRPDQTPTIRAVAPRRGQSPIPGRLMPQPRGPRPQRGCDRFALLPIAVVHPRRSSAVKHPSHYVPVKHPSRRFQASDSLLPNVRISPSPSSIRVSTRLRSQVSKQALSSIQVAPLLSSI